MPCLFNLTRLALSFDHNYEPILSIQFAGKLIPDIGVREGIFNHHGDSFSSSGIFTRSLMQ